MDPEIKRQLEEIHALVKDNHHLIRAVRRHQLFGIVMSIVFWLVILITPFYLYQQYLQPFVVKFQLTQGGTTTGGGATNEMQNLINSIKAKL
jgi:hypothetical protein